MTGMLCMWIIAVAIWRPFSYGREGYALISMYSVIYLLVSRIRLRKRAVVCKVEDVEGIKGGGIENLSG